MFDISNPTQKQQLKTELQADPRAYGYAAQISSGNDLGLAAVVNTIRDGTNIGPAITVRRSDIAPNEILEAIAFADFVANPAAVRLSWFESMSQLRMVKLQNDDGTDTTVFANLKSLITNGSQSQNRLNQASRRNGSRAEELWGTGSNVTDLDIAIALRG